MPNTRSGIDIRAALAPTLFGEAGEEVMEWVAQRIMVERYTTPSMLSAAGHALRHVRLVLEGRIDSISRSTGGKEVILSSFGTGCWVGWAQVFARKMPHFDTCCSAPSCLVALSAEDLHTCCERFPRLYPRLISEISERMQWLTEWTGQSVLMEPEQRMAKLLHLLAREQGLHGENAVLTVLQTRLAGLARCSRQSTSLLLGALEKRGLVRLAYGRCEIPDLRQLATFADSDPDKWAPSPGR